MKRRKLFEWLGGVLLLGVAVLFSACEDDQADIVFYSGSSLIEEVGTCTNAVSEVTLFMNGRETAEVGIAYGKGAYQAATSDVEIVRVEIVGDRLRLSCGEKEGRAVVMVSDEKGNQAGLWVYTGLGSIECAATGKTAVKAILNGNVIADEALQSMMAEALQGYRPMEEGGTLTFIPQNVEHWLLEGEEGTVKWTRNPMSGESVEGTYRFGYDDQLMGEPMECFLVSCKGELHRLYLNPDLNRSRETGPVSQYWVEDITAACPEDVLQQLPEQARVAYFMETVTWGGFHVLAGEE